MELEHTFTVPVPPAQAFAILQDIERIGPCMPGASIDSVDGSSFTGNVKVKIGPITVTYRGEAEYRDVDPEALTATIDARGKEARGSGTANAVVRATLTEVAEGAEVHVVTDLAITGRPAQFGRGVMEEVGQKLINQFATCLGETMAEDLEPAPAAGDAAEEPGAVTDAAAGTGADAATASAEGTSPTPTTAATARTAAAPPRREPEAIDLLDVAGAPVAKRLAPFAGGAVVLALLWWLIRRR